MDLFIQKNLISLILRIADLNNKTNPVVEQTGKKPHFKETNKPLYFDRVSPKSVGLDSTSIINFLDELNSCSSVFPHTVIVLKDGKAVASKAFMPYSLNNLHVTYSLCKSITSLAIGILVDKGLLSLDDNISDIFKGETGIPSNLFHSKIKVRHLLTMTSGVFANEAVIGTCSNWKKAFLESSRKNEPGEKFNYNSMNSYMLCAVITKITGKSVCDFLNENLFSHMDITDYYWEKSPEGIEKGGFGMYMLPEDMAKIGQLYLQKGVWNGKSLISKHWFEQACDVQVNVGNNTSSFDYGYHVWVKKTPHTLALNGMFGQNVIIFPDNNIVVAITGGNNDVFHENALFELAQKYFGNSDLNKKGVVRKTDNYSFELKASKRMFEAGGYLLNKYYLKKIDNTKYIFDKTKTGGISIFPLVLQVIQNNYTDGIESISFEKRNKSIYCAVNQGGFIYDFPACRDNYYICYSFNDETYKCCVSSRFSRNEDGVCVFSVKINFVETACVRYIKLYFEKQRIRLVMRETPGKEFLLNATKFIAGSLDEVKIPAFLKDKFDADILWRISSYAIEPEAYATIQIREDEKNINV